MMAVIPGYENYSATSSGDIYRNETGVKLKGVRCRDGYLHVSLSQNGVIVKKSIHRLVMMAFVGESSLQVDHINAVRDDNRLENLRYCTASQNSRYAWAMGLRNPYAHISNYEARLERAMRVYIDRMAGVPTGVVAIKHGVSAPTVCDIYHGRSWSFVKQLFNTIEGLCAPLHTHTQ